MTLIRHFVKCVYCFLIFMTLANDMKRSDELCKRENKELKWWLLKWLRWELSFEPSHQFCGTIWKKISTFFPYFTDRRQKMFSKNQFSKLISKLCKGIKFHISSERSVSRKYGNFVLSVNSIVRLWHKTPFFTTM